MLYWVLASIGILMLILIMRISDINKELNVIKGRLAVHASVEYVNNRIHEEFAPTTDIPSSTEQ